MWQLLLNKIADEILLLVGMMTKILNVRTIFEFLALSDEALQMIRIDHAIGQAVPILGLEQKRTCL